MKNENRIQNQNITNENQNRAISFRPVTPRLQPEPEPVAIGELLTLTEIEAVITQQVALSDAVATSLQWQRHRP